MNSITFLISKSSKHIGIMKKILITGANGLLGQKLIRLFLQHPEYEIFATSQGKKQSPLVGFKFIKADLTEEGKIEELMQYYHPNFVIHTAAMTQPNDCEKNPEKCLDINVKVVEKLSQICKKQNAFLLHLSTDFVFDGEKGMYTEKDEPNPISFYGVSKYEAEQVFQDSGVRGAIVRPCLVYGMTPNMSRSNLILWLKRSLEMHQHIKVVIDQYRTPTLAEDLAEGCRLIIEKEAQGIYHLAGKDYLTPYEIAVHIADHFRYNKSYLTKVTAGTFPEPATRPPKTGLNIDKARRELGYEPHSFEKGFEFVVNQMNFY